MFQDLYSERMATGEKALVLKQTLSVSYLIEFFYKVLIYVFVKL